MQVCPLTGEKYPEKPFQWLQGGLLTICNRSYFCLQLLAKIYSMADKFLGVKKLFCQETQSKMLHHYES